MLLGEIVYEFVLLSISCSELSTCRFHTANLVWVMHMGCILHLSYYGKTEGNTKAIYKCHAFLPIPKPITYTLALLIFSLFSEVDFFFIGDNIYVIMDPAGIACSFHNSAK